MEKEKHRFMEEKPAKRTMHVLGVVGRGLVRLAEEQSKIDATLLWARVASFVEGSPEGQMVLPNGGRVVRTDIVTGALLAHVVQMVKHLPLAIRNDWMVALARDLDVRPGDFDLAYRLSEDED